MVTSMLFVLANVPEKFAKAQRGSAHALMPNLRVNNWRVLCQV